MADVPQGKQIWFCTICRQAGVVEFEEQEDQTSVAYGIFAKHQKDSPDCNKPNRELVMVTKNTDLLQDVPADIRFEIQKILDGFTSPHLVKLVWYCDTCSRFGVVSYMSDKSPSLTGLVIAGHRNKVMYCGDNSHLGFIRNEADLKKIPPDIRDSVKKMLKE